MLVVLTSLACLICVYQPELQHGIVRPVWQWVIVAVCFPQPVSANFSGVLVTLCESREVHQYHGPRCSWDAGDVRNSFQHDERRVAVAVPPAAAALAHAPRPPPPAGSLRAAARTFLASTAYSRASAGGGGARLCSAAEAPAPPGLGEVLAKAGKRALGGGARAHALPRACRARFQSCEQESCSAPAVTRRSPFHVG
jgi:hypothetical protein